MYPQPNMSFRPEHVEAWMRGKQMESSLPAFQRLVFQFHSVMSGHKSSKVSMERALHTFRHKYLNKYMYEHQESPERNIKCFVDRIKIFDELKKVSKKDLISLIDDLCAFKNAVWKGGHNNNELVLSQWKPDIQECPALHQVWCKDDVEQLRLQFGFKKNMCAVCKKSYTWKHDTGPICPANLNIVCDLCEPDESVQSYLNACAPFMLTPRPTIQHVTDTCRDMYAAIAVHTDQSVEEQLHDIYKSRIPKEFDFMMAKRSMQNDIEHYKKQCAELERALQDANARADCNNTLYEECRVSLDAISSRLCSVEDRLSEYQNALRQRDNMIRSMHHTGKSIYNRW